MKVQDGAHVCPNCAYPMSLSEREQMHVAEVQRMVEKTARHAMPLEYPGSSLLAGEVLFERFTGTLPMEVARSGGTPVIVGGFGLEGINLSASDTLTAPSGFTVSDYTTAADGLSATFSLSADSSVSLGYHPLTFNGVTYRDVVRVTV